MNGALTSIVDEANQLLLDKKFDEAISTIQPILVQDTGGEGQKVYGMALLGLGRPMEAVQPLMEASQLIGKDETVAYAYGTALYQTKNTEGAHAAYERAFGLNPNHPGAKQGYLKTSKDLAEQWKATKPLEAIQVLYNAWSQDQMNPELAMSILDLYIANGWNAEAHQFAGMLPKEFQNSPTLKAKLKAAPLPTHVDAPPVNTRAGAAPTVPNQVTAFEECPFCRQQVMSGVHTCPYCKMVIRSKAMPGQDYKPDWQEVTLNILCWIGIAMNVFDFAYTFIKQEQSTPLGALTIVVSAIAVGCNALILTRNDFAMSIGKWIYLMRTIRGAFGTCTIFMIGSAVVTQKERQLVFIAAGLNLIWTLYSGLMVYLLNHEGAE